MFGPARKTMLGLCLAAGLVFAVTPALAVPSGGCVVGATTTCTFNYTGAPEAWVVPAGVTSGVFDVFGAQGGSFTFSLPGGLGGRGGYVQGTVALTPGATLNMRVGGKGGDGQVFIGATNPTVAGGFNGGGTNTFTCTNCSTTLGATGGGSSDVRTSTDGLADRLPVAGGGGGAGSGGLGDTLDAGGDSASAAINLPAWLVLRHLPVRAGVRALLARAGRPRYRPRRQRLSLGAGRCCGYWGRKRWPCGYRRRAAATSAVVQAHVRLTPLRAAAAPTTRIRSARLWASAASRSRTASRAATA